MSDSTIDIQRLTGIPRDTTPEAFWKQTEALRALGSAGRTRIAFDLTEMVWKTSEAGVRRRHPEYSAEQVRLAAIRLRLGDELFRLVYPNQDVAP